MFWGLALLSSINLTSCSSLNYKCIEGIQRICLEDRELIETIDRSLKKLGDETDKLILVSNKFYEHYEIREMPSLTEKFQNTLRQYKQDFTYEKNIEPIKKYSEFSSFEIPYDTYINNGKINFRAKSGHVDLGYYKAARELFSPSIIEHFSKLVETIFVGNSLNEYMVNHVYSNGKVYISKNLYRPQIDPIGNIYIPESLFEECSNLCIDAIIMHEVMHLLVRNANPQIYSEFMDSIFSLTSEFHNGDVQLEKFFEKGEQITGRVDESIIDEKVLRYFFYDENRRKAYLKLLNNHLNHTDNKEGKTIRYMLAKALNDYINETGSFDIFEMIDAKNTLDLIEMVMRENQINNFDIASVRSEFKDRLSKKLNPESPELIDNYFLLLKFSQ